MKPSLATSSRFFANFAFLAQPVFVGPGQRAVTVAFSPFRSPYMVSVRNLSYAFVGP